MNFLPQELRDGLIGQLEAALVERDRALRGAEADLERNRQKIRALEAALQRQRNLVSALRADLGSVQEAVEDQRRASERDLARLERGFRTRSEALLHQLEAARAEHHTAWERHARELARLRDERRSREVARRRTAAELLAKAGQLLNSFDVAELDALELHGSSLAARHLLAEAMSSRPSTADEALSTAAAVEGEAVRLAENVRARRRRLEDCHAQVAADAAWVERLLRGIPEGGLPDQRASVARLLGPETALMSRVIDRELRQRPEVAFRRYQAHGAHFTRFCAIRDRLAAEIGRARLAVPAAELYEQSRYDLSHVRDQIENTLGAVRWEGVRGTWTDPGDFKSAFFWFLPFRGGEGTVQIAWGAGPVLVHEQQEVPFAPPLQTAVPPDDETRYLGRLRDRWGALDEELARGRMDTKER